MTVNNMWKLIIIGWVMLLYKLLFVSIKLEISEDIKFSKVKGEKMFNRVTSPTKVVTTQLQQPVTKVVRTQAPEPQIYLETATESKIKQQSQQFGVNPSISFGVTGSDSFKMNAYPVPTAEGVDYYEGDLSPDGEFHGTGKYYFTKQNQEYHGEFERGKPHGKGVLYKKVAKISNNSTLKSATQSLTVVYEGEWRDGMKNGEGKHFYGSENHYYQGPWLNDLRHGNNGTYVSPMGKYVGRWEQGKMEGRGEFYIAKTGTKYQGNFQNNELIDGVIIYPNKDQYKGRVRNGLRDDNQGRYAYNGEGETAQLLYFGGWKNDMKSDKSGQGIITFGDGETFKGIYEENKFMETAPFQYQWTDGDVFNGWLQKQGGSLNLKGVVKKSNGKQYQV